MNDNRTAYRKNLKVAGTLVSGDIELPFFTKNVSLNGFQAYSTEVTPTMKAQVKSLETSDMVYVRLPELNMEGVVSVLWSQHGGNGQFDFGFKFLNMRGVDGSAFHYREADQALAD